MTAASSIALQAFFTFSSTAISTITAPMRSASDTPYMSIPQHTGQSVSQCAETFKQAMCKGHPRNLATNPASLRNKFAGEHAHRNGLGNLHTRLAYAWQSIYMDRYTGGDRSQIG